MSAIPTTGKIRREAVSAALSSQKLILTIEPQIPFVIRPFVVQLNAD